MLNNKKHKALLLSLVLLVLVGAGSVIAYIHTNTQAVENTFKPAQVTCTVLENEFDKVTKENVRIGNPKNDGKNVEAFIRVDIVVTWKMQDPDNPNKFLTYGQAPVEGTDYVLELGSSKWQKMNDGYYYYTDAVNPGEETAALINRCTPKTGTAPEGYKLSVEIIAEAVQAEGGSYVTVEGQQVWMPAVQQAWENSKVTFSVNEDATVLTVTNK